MNFFPSALKYFSSNWDLSFVGLRKYRYLKVLKTCAESSWSLFVLFIGREFDAQPEFLVKEMGQIPVKSSERQFGPRVIDKLKLKRSSTPNSVIQTFPIAPPLAIQIDFPFFRFGIPWKAFDGKSKLSDSQDYFNSAGNLGTRGTAGSLVLNDMNY